RAVALGLGRFLPIAGTADLPPLEQVERELANFQGTFGARGTVVRPEARVKASLARAYLDEPGLLLLLATHGRNDTAEPLESCLFFRPGPGEDGRLRARDLYGRPARAGLVILSACDSGLAERSPLPGDDLFGLQRALLQAGVRSVVSAQWGVRDADAQE